MSSRRASRSSSRCRTTSTHASHPRSSRTASRRSTRHQAEAWEAAQRGEHVVVTTGTASGKTLAFNLPVLDAIAREPKTRALYLYPTKALAQDQARSLASLRLKGLRPAIYDGDTPSERRWQIRKWSNLDPHQPRHAPRRRPAAPRPLGRRAREPPLRRRRRGARLPRRLRLARRATCCGGCGGSRGSTAPSRSSCSRRRRSRTPASSRSSSLGVEATVVDRDDGAPRAERDGRRSGTRRSSTTSSACARARSARRRGCWPSSSSRGLRTICFAKSRKAAELIHRFTAERVDSRRRSRLAPYRAGYTAEQRREIERRLVEGELLGVTATDALELGIDIGLLDCAISVGFPGTVASLRQQWGRAGRRGHGLAVLVASDDALDQFFMREPEALLDAARRGGDPRPREPARARRARPRRRVRGAARRRRRATLGAEALARAAELPELEAHAGGLRLDGPRLPGRARLAPLGRRRGVHGRRRRDRLGARPRRARARVLDRARGRRLPPPRRAVPRASRSTFEDRVARSSSRFAATGTRRRRRRRRRRSSRAAARRARARSRAPLRSRLGHRAGRRLPAEGDPRRLDDRRRAVLDCPRRRSRPRRSGSAPSRRSSRASSRCRSSSARSTRPSTR